MTEGRTLLPHFNVPQKEENKMGNMIPETLPVIVALDPQAASTVADAADWVSLKNAKGVWIIVQHAGTSDNDVVLTVHEGTTGAGTTAITTGAEFKIWANAATATSDALVRQTDGITYTIDSNGGGSYLIVMYVPAAVLSPGYSWIQLGTDAGHASNFVSALYILDGERYQQATPPSAVV
jgi:hypothetical protein